MDKRRPIKANKVELKKWTGNKKTKKVQQKELHNGGGSNMAVLAKPCDFIITITKENEHVLKPEMTEERKKKIALMKKRAAIITKNME